MEGNGTGPWCCVFNDALFFRLADERLMIKMLIVIIDEWGDGTWFSTVIKQKQAICFSAKQKKDISPFMILSSSENWPAYKQVCRWTHFICSSIKNAHSKQLKQKRDSINFAVKREGRDSVTQSLFAAVTLLSAANEFDEWICGYGHEKIYI